MEAIEVVKSIKLLEPSSISHWNCLIHPKKYGHVIRATSPCPMRVRLRHAMNTAEIVSDMPHGASNKIKAIFELLIGCGFVIYEFLIGCVKKMS